ncbi:hypothetical protein D9M68_956950 [compost metagenome]
MVVESAGYGGFVDDHRLARKRRCQHAAAARGQPLGKEIAEDIDLAKNCRQVFIACDIAGDRHAIGKPKGGHVGEEVRLDSIHALDEGAGKNHTHVMFMAQ